MNRLWPAVGLAAFLTLPISDLPARQQKEPPKDQAKALVALPLGISAGTTAKLTIRGLKLDAATAVKAVEPNVAVKLLGKARVGAPNQQDVNKVGDTQAEIEITVPADHPGATVSVVFVTPSAETAPLVIVVDQVAALVEKEPNNGFDQAQPLAVGQVVQGSIGGNQDVDVFRVEGKAGQKVTFEVFAARLGSALDSVLTLYDAGGQVLAVNDDHDNTTDSRIDITFPRDGVYYLGLIDAHDQGGPAHVYRLQARPR
jgi:hypothetical protein